MPKQLGPRVESVPVTGVFGQIFWQELQADETMQLGIFSLKHYTHPAPAKLLKDVVVRNRFSNHDESDRDIR